MAIAQKRGRNLKRVAEIAEVAARHGLGYWVARAGIRVRTLDKGDQPLPEEVLARRLRSFLEELGPTFVKIGQLISVRPDLVPPEVVFEFENLLDETSPLSFEIIKTEVENSLERPIDEVFERFDPNPIASASIGQVHRAKLREGGHDVAVKVQRPGIQAKIEADLDIIATIAAKVQTRVDVVDLSSVVQEFSDSLHRELDYRTEARHIDRFRFNFKEDELIRVPIVHWKYTSRRLLVLEYIEGWKLSELAEPESLGIDTFALAKHGAEAFMKQVLEDGFFHGDLHPANLLITPESKIAYLDFGIVGTIPVQDKEAIARMLLGIIRHDVDEIIAESRALGVDITADKIEDIRVGLKDAIDKYSGKKLGEIKIDVIGREFLSLIYRNHIRIPRNYALLAKALITVEGTAKKLYPDINILEIAQPYVVGLINRRYGREMTAEAVYDEIKSQLRYAFDFPRQIHEVLNQIRAGELKVRYHHAGLEPLLSKLDSTVNRLVVGLLLASIILGSSLLSLAARGQSTVSIVMFVLAALLALWLISTSWRNRV
ncbi:MAG: AarF/ABC1/UbiB kinase family protein [Actinobacteria bacterium]|nr:AarF/ABC1/UbiB kinase family protein [Actinomycetota bacterium]